VILVVAALHRSAASRVAVVLSTPPMRLAWATLGQFPTPWGRTGVQDDPAGRRGRNGNWDLDHWSRC
jgi:hypothetical protein